MYKWKANALMSLLMLLILSGCATTTRVQQVVVKEEVLVKITPPVELVADCEHPDDPVNPRYADLVLWINEYRNALVLCNMDKQKIRQWMDDN